MKKAISFLSLLVLAVLLVFSTACDYDGNKGNFPTDDEDALSGERHYCTEPGKNADMCTMEFSPVCGDNGRTYSNSCVACSSGEIEYWIEGECGSDGGEDRGDSLPPQDDGEQGDDTPTDKYLITYSDEYLYYDITQTKPSPCHDMLVDVKVMESYPAQVRIDIRISEPEEGEMCAQVITEETLAGEIYIGHKPGYVEVRVDNDIVFSNDFQQDVHVCTEDEKNNEMCTREYNPVCGDDGETYSNGCVACSSGEIDVWNEGACPEEDNATSSLSSLCENLGGKWIGPAEECEGISEQDCDELGGEFNSCASACRNDPDAEVCTMQCVMVCELG